jgi:hypothetical protein
VRDILAHALSNGLAVCLRIARFGNRTSEFSKHRRCRRAGGTVRLHPGLMQSAAGQIVLVS